MDKEIDETLAKLVGDMKTDKNSDDVKPEANGSGDHTSGNSQTEVNNDEMVDGDKSKSKKDPTKPPHTDEYDGKRSTVPAETPVRRTTSGTDSFRHTYNMTHPKRGLAVVINNRDFSKTLSYLGSRTGTDVDAAHLHQTFSSLGFEVEVHHNKSSTDMLRIMRDAGARDHSNHDCFAAAVLSHGDDGGIVYGTDAPVHLDALVTYFKGDRCKSLIGKPKLFFVQACRGTNLDHGVQADDISGNDSTRIPTEADFLMAFSTVPGYFSWRNSAKGSWFVQAITKVFQEFAKEKEIMYMMGRVNRMVAYDFESNAPSKPGMHMKKQIPCIVYMLTKELYFTPKK